MFKHFSIAYLQVKPLLDLSCAKLASLVKGKNAEQKL